MTSSNELYIDISRNSVSAGTVALARDDGAMVWMVYWFINKYRW
jgi:hypothetical protein